MFVYALPHSNQRLSPCVSSFPTYQSNISAKHIISCPSMKRQCLEHNGATYSPMKLPRNLSVQYEETVFKLTTYLHVLFSHVISLLFFELEVIKNNVCKYDMYITTQSCFQVCSTVGLFRFRVITSLGFKMNMGNTKVAGIQTVVAMPAEVDMFK